MNTPEFRTEILNRIERDGINLKEFNEDQQARIIKQYAAVLLTETK